MTVLQQEEPQQHQQLLQHTEPHHHDTMITAAPVSASSSNDADDITSPYHGQHNDQHHATMSLDSPSLPQMPVGSLDCRGNSALCNTEFEEVVDVVQVMRMQESTSYKRSDYLHHAAPQSQRLKHVLDGSWRQRIVEWMYGVVDHCSLRRDSVATATYYLDLCVERGLIASREEYQLAAMTALEIAIKLCDSTVVKLQSMVALGRGLFTEQDVITMEGKMLQALNWQMHPPTPVCFLRQFLRLLPSSISPITRYMIAEVTRFISEISVCLYKFVKYPPSVIAYSGMLIAMQRFDDGALPLRQRNEIFTAMSCGAGMDVHAPLIIEAVTSLQLSLEKNVSLQELMNSIDAQCHEGYSKMRGEQGDFANGKVPGSGCLSSPRDVMGRHP